MTNKPTTNEGEAVRKNTVFAKLRRALYNAVESQTRMKQTQWDDDGRCYMVQAYGDRGIIATMQRKANNKGWIVFFAMSILKENNSKPFIRDLNIRLTVNETPNGVRLLWFVKGKPQWWATSREMSLLYDLYGNGAIIEELMKQIQYQYAPEDFVPILKYMQVQFKFNFDPYGLTPGLIKRLSGGTNPKQLLNKIYGKDGQDGLTKNAFGGLSNIKSLASLVVASELVRCFKSFPSSFFDKIYLPDFGKDDISIICQNKENTDNIRYFVKYFNHNKIKREFIDEINSYNNRDYLGSRYTYVQGSRFFSSDLWVSALNCGRLFKQITDKAIRRNILAFKGTVAETEHFIRMEHLKLTRENKEIKYKDNQIVLDNQRITDNIISVLPKETFDLIFWGSEQHHCLGTYDTSAADSSSTVIVGFKNLTTGEWIGHAELRNPNAWKDFYNMREDCWHIAQLRGKYNNNLSESDDLVIRDFLDNNIAKWNNRKQLSQ